MANTTNFGWETPDDTDLVKDGAAAMRTLGSAIDTSMADLRGGTTGQILSKNSNTDMDFVWVANDVGDITAVNVTSPITGGGSSGSVTISIQDATTAQKGAVQLENSTSSTSTTTAAVPASVKSAYDLANAAIPKSLIDAEGDLIVGDAADAVQRLAIGTTGQVLTVDTAIDGKIKWASAAGGGANWTLVNSGGTSLSGAATITVSGISGADKVNVLIVGGSAGTNSNWSVRVNSDSGSNYNTHGFYVLAGLTFGAGQVTQNVSSAGATSIPIGIQSGANDSIADGYIYFTGANASGIKMFHSAMGYSRGTGEDGQRAYAVGGYWNSSSTISSVSIISSNGNFDAGTVYVYTSA